MQQEKRIPFFVILGWILLLIAVGGGWFLYSTQFLTAQHFRCKVGENECPSYVVAELNKEKGKLLFSAEIEAAAQRITGYVPSLKGFSFVRQLPHTVAVQFHEAQPAYQIVNEGKTPYIIDESGVVIDQREEASLPKVVLSAETFAALTLREKIPTPLHEAVLDVVEVAEKHQIGYTQLRIVTAEELRLELLDGKVAQLHVGSSGNVRSAMMKLALVLKSVDFAALKSPVNTIDLRFKYPVLKADHL